MPNYFTAADTRDAPLSNDRYAQFRDAVRAKSILACGGCCAMADLMCPKCQAPMRSIERSGVTIERCTECGGVFLDRGELERLEESEMAAAPGDTGPTNAAATGPGGQALFGELLNLARQYRGKRGRY